ncbi:DUF397 domain-containing protein [Streptomyces griseoviridis]
MIRNAPAGNASGLAWFKSSYSSGNEPDSCVEVAPAPDVVHVRDSKNIGGPQLVVAGDVWGGFVAGL